MADILLCPPKPSEITTKLYVINCGETPWHLGLFLTCYFIVWILVSDDSEKSDQDEENTDDEVACLRGMYMHFQVIKSSVPELCQRMHGMSLGCSWDRG